MMKGLLLTTALLLPSISASETVVAQRTIRSQTILTAADLAVLGENVPGTVSDPSSIVGLEARVTLYAGRPIRLSDVGPAALVERNQIVNLEFSKGTLRLSAEGRALDRGAVGERIRVMNLGSRATVAGTISETGSVIVSGSAIRQ